MSRSEKITFTGALGDELAARLDSPDGKVRAYALFAHCFTCTKDIFAASRIAEGLTAHGIAVLRFDFTGLGASEGEFANTNFTSNVGDLVAAAGYMREHLSAPKILIGHSLGGAAVLAAAPEIAEVEAVCTIGAPADPGHVANNFGDDIKKIDAEGEADVTLVGRPFRIKKQFLDDIRAQKLKDIVARLGRALLIFHSPVDNIVGIENAQEIYIAAKHPKSFVSLDNADHLLSKRTDAVYCANVIAAWAERYIEADVEADSEVDVPAVADGVVVQETGQGKFANIISVGGRHLLHADEPLSVGGNDSGPSPYDYLMAALGSCKAMTMRMYAERKGWPLKQARVTLRHDKIHAEDCATCDTEKGMVDRIDAEIALSGDLSAEQRQKIFEIAERCPVHQTLTHEISLTAKLFE
ncbi:bifunctional alpha/beta hydrolase/OsmC family protein [Thalassospiraceae bacterium LMO-JJ14]|nr:bifunctional alpha/beta hydrolase/OsmC family protein [Thalassospiraceae bacterium LMO-JJ14]